MKVWPFGVAGRAEASNHHMLRWLKTVVVSDVEKAPVRCQVGTRKMSNPEPLLMCRQARVASKPWPLAGLWKRAWRVTRFLARWCPAWRRHEPGLLLLQETWEGASRHCGAKSVRCELVSSATGSGQGLSLA